MCIKVLINMHICWLEKWLTYLLRAGLVQKCGTTEGHKRACTQGSVCDWAAGWVIGATGWLCVVCNLIMGVGLHATVCIGAVCPLVIVESGASLGSVGKRLCEWEWVWGCAQDRTRARSWVCMSCLVSVTERGFRGPISAVCGSASVMSGAVCSEHWLLLFSTLFWI